MDKIIGFRHAALDKMTLGGKHRLLPEAPIPTEEIVSNVKRNGRKALDFERLFFCYRNPSSIDLLV